MSRFNWEDYQARVAEYVIGGMDAQSAELQVQHEMEDEQLEYEEWSKEMELAPDLAEAHAWRGAIFLVQADLAAARAECDALGRLKRDILRRSSIG